MSFLLPRPPKYGSSGFIDVFHPPLLPRSNIYVKTSTELINDIPVMSDLDVPRMKEKALHPTKSPFSL